MATARTLSEALPYIRRYHRRTVVIKYGGRAMAASRAGFARDIALLHQLGVNVIVVHGGGPQIGAMLKRLGVDVCFENGLRVTDAATMEVVEMVLAGAINTSVVSAVNAAGGKAVGLSGVDGGMIMARKVDEARIRDPDSSLERVVDLGLVGEPERIEPKILQSLAASGFIPIVAPVGVGRDGVRYNINADAAAGAIAASLGATRLLMMTDVPGVLDKDGKLLRRLDAETAMTMIAEGTASGGMIPKLQTALQAMRNGVEAAVILDGAKDHALLMELFTEHGVGTLLV